MDELGQGPHGPHDAEKGQEHVPQGQDPGHLEPGPRAHEVLAPEDDQQVEAGRPRADGPPVVLHPRLHLGVLEVALKVEHVGVVGRGQTHFRFREKE